MKRIIRMKLRTIKYIILIVMTCLASCNQKRESPIQEPESVPHFGFHMTGGDFVPRFGKTWYSVLDSLYQDGDGFNCILQTIATEPKTKEDISADCGLSAQWVNNAVDSLVAHNCFGITAGQKYYSKVPVFTKETMKKMLVDLKPISESVAVCINRWLPLIKKEYSENKLPTDPEWDDIAHFVLDKLILDGQFHQGLVKLEREEGFKRYYSEDQIKVPTWFKEYNSPYGTYGCNWYSFKSKNSTTMDIYYMHGSPLMRFSFPLNKYRNSKEFYHAILKVGLDGSLEELNMQEKEILEALGWTRENKVPIPIISAGSLKSLFENTLREVGLESANIVFDNYNVILESYKNSPYSDFSEGAGDYIQVCYHLLFNGIANELVQLGATAPFPQPVPEYYGIYITIGSIFN